MKINTSSWHYKVCTVLLRSVPRDFCAYVRQFLLSVVVISVFIVAAAGAVASIFTVLVAFLPGFYIDIRNSVCFGLGVAPLAALATLGILWVFLEKILPFFSKVKAARTPGEFEQYISGKLCPIIEFVSKEKP